MANTNTAAHRDAANNIDDDTVRAATLAAMASAPTDADDDAVNNAADYATAVARAEKSRDNANGNADKTHARRVAINNRKCASRIAAWAMAHPRVVTDDNAAAIDASLSADEARIIAQLAAVRAARASVASHIPAAPANVTA
jgi:hypothetical protein